MTYDKTEMNAFVQTLYDQKMQEGKHGHYETMFTREQLQQYGDQRDQAGYLRGLEDAAKVLEENAKQCSLVLERYVLEANAAVIRAMKGGE